jgi:hypothetical protein
VSATEFAEKVGTSRPRVVRYLDAWERAAAAGLVPTPGERLHDQRSGGSSAAEAAPTAAHGLRESRR